MPDKRKRDKPELTADRQIPGSFEGESVTRRRFMTSTVHISGAVATAAFTLPALGFALGPVFEEVEQDWIAVGPSSDFEDDTYVPKVITTSPGIGDTGKTTVYVRRFNPRIDKEPRDEHNAYIAISTRCMHLGCPVRFVPASERFICPCHGGVYDVRGAVSGGPPVRPLDRFYTRERNGQIEVGPRYSLDSRFRRYSPRDPGQDLDGVGQYLYPARPTIRKLPDS